MVRSVTEFDEDFTDDDAAAALVWQTEDALRCGGCGGPTDETMATGADDNYDAEIVVCHRCAAGDRAERAFGEGHGETAGAKRRTWQTDDYPEVTPDG